jgi:heme exporter protein CcmD
MVNHTPFIVGAYIVAVVGFGGLVIVSLLARRKAKRELAARGLSGERGRR